MLGGGGEQPKAFWVQPRFNGQNQTNIFHTAWSKPYKKGCSAWHQALILLSPTDPFSKGKWTDSARDVARAAACRRWGRRVFFLVLLRAAVVDLLKPVRTERTAGQAAVRSHPETSCLGRAGSMAASGSRRLSCQLTLAAAAPRRTSPHHPCLWCALIQFLGLAFAFLLTFKHTHFPLSCRGWMS